MVKTVNVNELGFFKTSDIEITPGTISCTKLITIDDVEERIINRITQTRRQLINLYNKDKWKRGKRK